MSNIEIVNLTPHSITVQTPNGPWTVAPSGTIARAVESELPLDDLEGIPLTDVYYVRVDGIPAERPGVFYIVSVITAEAAYHLMPARADLLVPGAPLRDDAGRVIGAASLRRWRPMHSHRSQLDSLRAAGKDFAIDAYGYTMSPSELDDQAMNMVWRVAAHLVTACAASPSSRSFDIVDAIADLAPIARLAADRDMQDRGRHSEAARQDRLRDREELGKVKAELERMQIAAARSRD